MKKSVKKEVEKIASDWGDLPFDYTIKEFQDKMLNHYPIAKYYKLSEDFIREFQLCVGWSSICMYQDLSENFIREFKDKVDWGWVSEYQKLSLDFIREFKDKVDWDWVSKYQKLSLDFIREFQNKVDWYQIPRYQKLSENFIYEYEDRLDINHLIEEGKITRKELVLIGNKEKIRSRFDILDLEPKRED